jgi:hypothetical protein
MLALAGAQTKVMKRSTQLVRPLKSDASSTTMPELEKVTQIPQPGQEKRNQLSDLRATASGPLLLRIVWEPRTGRTKRYTTWNSVACASGYSESRFELVHVREYTIKAAEETRHQYIATALEAFS